MDSYVLEIPDLGYVINQDTIGQWEVFLRHTGKGFQKVHWQASSSISGFVFRNVSLKASPVESVRIDLKANCIIFYKGNMGDKEFQDYLRLLIDAFFIRVRPNHMHFMVSPNYLVRKDSGIRE